MRVIVASLGFALFFAQNVFALDSSAVRELKALAPHERLEQRCDIEAMTRIGKANAQMRPDKVIAYTFAKTVVEDNKLTAPGAVFRSREKWYHLKYVCQTSNENLDVTNFSFQVGAEVPKESWSKYYLYQ